MKLKASWGIAALLGVACLAEAGYIVSHRAIAAAPPARDAAPPARDAAGATADDLRRWADRAHEEIARTGALGEKDFDELFGDDFFRRRFDPFEEIDRVRKRLEGDLAETERARFGASFDDWFSKRIGLDGISTKVTDRGKDVAVTFGIPGLDEDSVKFDVNADRIRMRYATRTDVKKKGSDVETSTSVEKILPLPDGADPAGFEVKKGKDEITLVFHKARPAA